MSWTLISKPTGTPYSYVNTQGKEQYDQNNLTFDDASIFFDGTNMAAWTNVSKPAGGGFIIRGMATALLMPLTYSKSYDASAWTKISKPLD